MKRIQIVIIYQKKSLLDYHDEREFITSQIVWGFLPIYHDRMKVIYIPFEDEKEVKKFTKFDYRVFSFNFNTVRFRKIEKTFYVKLKPLKDGEEIRKRSKKFSKKILQKILWMMTRDGRDVVCQRKVKINENTEINIVLGKKRFLYAPCTSPGKNLILLHLKIRLDNSVSKKQEKNDFIHVELSIEQHNTNRMIMQACKNDSTKVILFSFGPRVDKDFIKKILFEGIRIRYDDTDHTFYYFGCSGSQLKKNECFLLDANDPNNILPLIQKYIHLDQLSPLISKKSARVGLLFSKVKEYIDLYEFESQEEEGSIIITVEEIEDVERNGHIFTDGNGFISFYFAHEIASKFLGLDYTPSVFQIRYLGYKGVLNVNKFSREGVKKPRIIQFRKSMKKFNSPPEVIAQYNLLGICDYSKPTRLSYINQQIIQLLSGLGVRDETFLELQDDYFKRLLSSLSINARFFFDFLVYNDEIETLHHLIKSYEEERYNHHGQKETSQKISYQKEQMKAKHVKKNIIDMESKKMKLRIPCFESRIIFGIADFTGTLRRNEVYVRVSLSPGRIQTIVGKVVVGKNPCYYPGDIKVLQAVDLNIPYLFDCIVFSVHGDVPIVHEMSGSDLDGDMYFVSWKKELIPPLHHKSYSYESAVRSSSINENSGDEEEPTLRDYIQHFVDFNRGILGYIDYCYNYWCNKEGVMSEKCKLLGTKYFSKAVDSAKTGAKVRIPKQMVPPRKKQSSPTLEDRLKELNENMIHSKMKIRNINFYKKHFMNNREIRQQQQQFMTSLNIPDQFFLDLLSIPFYSDFEIFSLLLSYDRHIGLQNYTVEDLFEYFDYSRFSSHEIKTALFHGVDKSLVLNGINLSSILSKREIGCSRIIDPKRFWKLYSRDDQTTFNFMKLCDAFRKYKKIVLIFQTLETEKILVHVSLSTSNHDKKYMKFKNNNDVDGQVDAWYFKGDRLFYKSNLKSKKRKNQNEKFRLYFDTNRLQIFDEHEGQTFLWMKDDRKTRKGMKNNITNEKDRKVRISVNLNEFNQNLVRNRGRMNKHPWKQVEVYVSQQPIYTEDKFHLESNFYTEEEEEESDEDDEEKKQVTVIFADKKMLNEKRKVYLDLKSEKSEEIIKLLDEEKQNIIDKYPHLLDRKSILLNSTIPDFLFRHSSDVFLGEVFYTNIISEKKVVEDYFPQFKLNREDLPFLVSYFAENGMFEECIVIAGFQKKWNEEETQNLWKIFFQLVHLSIDPDILQDTFRIIKKNPSRTLSEEVQFSDLEERELYIDAIVNYFCSLMIWNLDSVAFELMDLIFQSSLFDMFSRIIVRKNKKYVSQFLFSLILIEEKDEEKKKIILESFFKKYFSKLFSHVIDDDEEEEEEGEGESDEDDENVDTTRTKVYNPYELFDFYGKLLIRETWYDLPHKNRNSCLSTLSFVGDEKSSKTVTIQTKILSNDRQRRNLYLVTNDIVYLYSLDSTTSEQVFVCEGIVTESVPLTKIKVKIGVGSVLHRIKLTTSIIKIVKKFNGVQLSRIFDAVRRVSRDRNHYIHRLVFHDSESFSGPINNIEVETFPHDPKLADFEEICSIMNEKQKNITGKNFVNSISIVRGPPGTGKTMCLSRLVHLWVNLRNEKEKNISSTQRLENLIVCCAQTNESIDHIIEELRKFGISVLRMGKIEKTRPKFRSLCFERHRRMHQSLLAQCGGEGEDGHFSSESLISKFDVVCGTVNSLGCRALQNISFRQLLVDEASQTMIPELLIPLSKGNSQVVFFGDDLQLNPLVKTPEEDCHLKKTIFDLALESGFLEVEMYEIQYRMVKQICEFPSSEFYGGKLETHEEVIVTDSKLVTMKERVIFFDCKDGVEERGRDSSTRSSYMNKKECEWITSFLKHRSEIQGVKRKEIGIIVPYRGQRNYVKESLRRENVDRWSEIQVSTVDGFQGKEKELIFVSTVRTNGVGFLDDPKRLNVLLTRAKFGLFVFGNRGLLETIPCWKKWLGWIDDNELSKEFDSFMKKDTGNVPQGNLQKKKRRRGRRHEVPSYHHGRGRGRGRRRGRWRGYRRRSYFRGRRRGRF